MLLVCYERIAFNNCRITNINVELTHGITYNGVLCQSVGDLLPIPVLFSDRGT
ncbi:hypothetical protein ALTER154_50021 [Alteromonas sp. 154]|nr:hypothetical protein ALTER154_50021 [Alteromonas sp. 154]